MRLIGHDGIKQTWLVEQLGMTQAWVNRLVNHKSIPNVYDAQRIANLLGATIEELWALEGESAERPVRPRI